MRLALVAAIALLALAGCGGEPDRPAGSAEDTARSYVESLNHKDGARFCSLVAPYLAGRFDLAAHELWGRREAQAEKKLGVDGGCALFVSAYTGYIDDPGEQWKRAELLSVGPVRRQGSLTAVPLRLRHHYVDSNDEQPSQKEEDDVVYLARFDGRWRIAKLSAVAHRASLGGVDTTPPSAAPDVKAEQARYAALKAKTDDRAQRERGAYKQSGGQVDCAGRMGRVTDPAGDVEDEQHHAQDPDPDAPEADIRSATIVPPADRYCVTVELGAAPKGELVLILRIRNHRSPGSGGNQDFLGTVTAERRDDGRWRVSSGEDDDEHPRLVPAQVAEDGAHVSFAIKRSDVQYAEDLPPTSDFVWSVESLVPRPDHDGALADDAPNGYGVVYPSNRDCGAGTDGSCATG